jgi:hypothetical protein
LIVRVVAAYWLVFAMAAGPWLCCCATIRAAAVLNLLKSTIGLDGNHTGCCGGSPRGGLPVDQNAPGPTSPTGCPCKTFVSDQFVLPPETTGAARAAADQVVGLGHSTGLSTPNSQHLFFASASSLRDRDTLVRSGDPRDLLSVLQTLRC